MAEQKKENAQGLRNRPAVPAPSSTPEEELVDYADREPEKVVPEKGSDGHDTPSGYALAKVGPDGDGDEYAAVKHGKRWGYA